MVEGVKILFAALPVIFLFMPQGNLLASETVMLLQFFSEALQERLQHRQRSH